MDGLQKAGGSWRSSITPSSGPTPLETRWSGYAINCSLERRRKRLPGPCSLERRRNRLPGPCSQQLSVLIGRKYIKRHTASSMQKHYLPRLPMAHQIRLLIRSNYASAQRDDAGAGSLEDSAAAEVASQASAHAKNQTTFVIRSNICIQTFAMRPARPSISSTRTGRAYPSYLVRYYNDPETPSAPPCASSDEAATATKAEVGAAAAGYELAPMTATRPNIPPLESDLAARGRQEWVCLAGRGHRACWSARVPRALSCGGGCWRFAGPCGRKGSPHPSYLVRGYTGRSDPPRTPASVARQGRRRHQRAAAWTIRAGTATRTVTRPKTRLGSSRTTRRWGGGDWLGDQLLEAAHRARGAGHRARRRVLYLPC
jgi:hypothetical protein